MVDWCVTQTHSPYPYQEVGLLKFTGIESIVPTGSFVQSAKLKVSFVDPEVDGAQVLGRYIKQVWWDGVGNGIYKDDNTPISWVKATATANWAGMGCTGEGVLFLFPMQSCFTCLCAQAPI